MIVTVGAAEAFLGFVAMRGVTTEPKSIISEKVAIKVFLKWIFLYCFIRINFKALQVRTQVFCKYYFELRLLTDTVTATRYLNLGILTTRM